MGIFCDHYLKLNENFSFINIKTERITKEYLIELKKYLSNTEEELNGGIRFSVGNTLDGYNQSDFFQIYIIKNKIFVRSTDFTSQKIINHDFVPIEECIMTSFSIFTGYRFTKWNSLKDYEKKKILKENELEKNIDFLFVNL